MSKKMIEAFCKAQYNALNAKDNKERIGYMIAGIKDGKFYDLKTDTDYGVFDETIPDTVFIPESALEIQRVTGAKLATFSVAMNKFFEKYGSNPKQETEETEEAEEAEDVDYTALEKACKKAIKKGDLTKATKLLEELDGQDCHKKLSKKLAKASK